jgi:DNA-binding transcriptional regulator of glucitol operon
MLKIDGHDNAIIGPAMIWRDNSLVDVLVYDAEAIRENLMKDGMTAEEAREYIEFNIEGAYMGEHTPVLVWPADEWEHLAGEDE